MMQHFDSSDSNRAAILGDRAAILGDPYAVPGSVYPQQTDNSTPARSGLARSGLIRFSQGRLASPDWISTASRPTQSEVSDTFRYRVIKRGIDIVLVLLAAPLLLPVFALVALIVWINCPGPVFFSHRRIRRNHSFFPMWKFRTMCVNSAEVLEHHLRSEPAARAEWHLTQKLRNDPRVTRIGAFLRQYSIDELPQLWNVLTGEMSLVGPRPIVEAEIEKYGRHFLCYGKVKPGITGLWQVSGRSHLSYEARVALDCEYVHHWSLLLDLKVLLKTFSSVINRHGAF